MKVELSLYALKLKNVAGFAHGTSNPFAIVSLLTKGVPPRVLGQTEVVENTLSPNWVKVFVFDYELGTPCEVACAVHDKQSGNHMGSATFDIGQTLGAKGSTKAKNMNGKGTLYATVRKSSGSGVFHFKFRGENVRFVVVEVLRDCDASLCLLLGNLRQPNESSYVHDLMCFCKCSCIVVCGLSFFSLPIEKDGYESRTPSSNSVDGSKCVETLYGIPSIDRTWCETTLIQSGKRPPYH